MRSRPIIRRIIAAGDNSAAIERADHASVAQHHGAIGALHHLVQAMRDENDADATGLQPRDDPHQAASLGQGQAGGRLVHDDETRIERQRLDDLDKLTLGQRQFGKRRIGPEIGAETVEQRPHLGMKPLAVDQFQRPAMHGLAADIDVARNVEIIEEVELLVDEGNARLDRVRDGE